MADTTENSEEEARMALLMAITSATERAQALIEDEKGANIAGALGLAQIAEHLSRSYALVTAPYAPSPIAE